MLCKIDTVSKNFENSKTMFSSVNKKNSSNTCVCEKITRRRCSKVILILHYKHFFSRNILCDEELWSVLIS